MPRSLALDGGRGGEDAVGLRWTADSRLLVLSSEVERMELSTNEGMLREGALVALPWRGPGD